MFLLVSSMIAFVEALLLYVVLAVCLGKKKQYCKYYYIFPIVDALLVVSLNKVFDTTWIPIVVSFVYEVTVLHFACYGRIWTKTLFILLYDVLFIGIDTLIYFASIIIFNFKADEITNDRLVNIIPGVTSKVVLCIVISLFISLYKKKQYRLSLKKSIPIFVIPITSVWVLIFLFDYSANIDLSSLAAGMVYGTILGLLVMNLFLLVLYNRIAESEEARTKMELMQQQITYYNELKVSYEKTTALKHDFEKHLRLIRALLQEKQYEELEKYVLGVKNIQKNYHIQRYTGDIVLDSIISDKHKYTIEKGIDFFVSAQILPNAVQEPIYMCVLLGNVLDNAIEECERLLTSGVEYVYIRIKICIDERVDEKGILISVSNTSEPPFKVGNNILSKKKDSLNHGYGLKNIEEVVSKMNGCCTYGYENGEFAVIAKIPMEKLQK